MMLSLKKKVNLTKEQERVADAILDHFGIGGALAIGYVEDSRTGKSVAMVPCVQTGEMLQFGSDRPQSRDEMAVLIPHQLSRLITTEREGAFCDREDVDSIDTLFDLVNVID